MTRVNLPPPDKVRILLTDPKLPPAEIDRIGDLFLEDGRPSIAAMFYERTRTPDRAKLILDQGIRDGDAFLVDWVSRILPDAATPDAWRRCAEAAERLGKTAFARTAYVRAGNPEKAVALKD